MCKGPVAGRNIKPVIAWRRLMWPGQRERGEGRGKGKKGRKEREGNAEGTEEKLTSRDVNAIFMVSTSLHNVCGSLSKVP